MILNILYINHIFFYERVLYDNFESKDSGVFLDPKNIKIEYYLW